MAQHAPSLCGRCWYGYSADSEAAVPSRLVYSCEVGRVHGARPLALPHFPCEVSLASGELHTLLLPNPRLNAGLACVAAKIGGISKWLSNRWLVSATVVVSSSTRSRNRDRSTAAPACP